MEIKPQIKIYRDGQLSRWETFKPIIHANILTLGNRIDRFFVTGRWAAQELSRDVSGDAEA